MISSESKMILVCGICSGTNVQIRVWVDANTLEYKSDTEDNDAWCEDCQEHVTLELKSI